MSFRVIICMAVVVGFSIYAWRNWFVSLCGVVILMAFLEHPDMPHSIADIQGLNPWNVLMANVLGAWWLNRRREGLVWDLPGFVLVLFLMYFFVIVWSFVRMLGDYELLDVLNLAEYSDYIGNGKVVHHTLAWVTSDYLINCVKWILPGILLFDACRTRQRIKISLIVLFFFYLLLALQVVKHMPLGAVAMSGTDLSRISAKILDKSVGYFRSELSMIFSGASWAILTMLVLVDRGRNKFLMLGAAGLVTLAQAETGGRAGYVTWGLIGLLLCIFRWRRYLPILPVIIMLVCIFLPGVRDRMLQGFVSTPQGEQLDEGAITSNRTVAWGYVIPMIWKSPVIGYGRQAMIRIGLWQKILQEQGEGETFPHPHNAYLEVLLDNGFVGFFLVIPFYVVVVWLSFKLFRDKADPVFLAAGGTALTLVLALLIASMGGESFYPKESSLGMWSAIGIMFRVWLERRRSLETGQPLFGEEDEDYLADATDEPVRLEHYSV